MEEKIIEYVNYKFRFRKSKDVEDSKAEIIANLTDRYFDLLKDGKSMQEAYVESIRSFGNFSNETLTDNEADYVVKPSLADISLVVGAILSIFGLFVSLLNFSLGLILTITSIVLYSGGAYYLYAYSQYVKVQELDIEKHNSTLKKIFKYMKTCYVFWAISLSYYVAHLASDIVATIGSLYAINNPWQLLDIIFVQIVISIFVFILAIIASILVFTNLYNRLLHKYYQLTGEVYLKGKIRESYEFIYQDNSDTQSNMDYKLENATKKEPKKPTFILNKNIYIFVIISAFLVSITNLFKISYGTFDQFHYLRSGVILSLIPEILYTNAYLAGLFYIQGFVVFLTAAVLILIGLINYRWLILANFVWLLSNYMFLIILSNQTNTYFGIYDFYILLLSFIGFVLLIVWSIVNLIKRRKLTRNAS